MNSHLSATQRIDSTTASDTWSPCEWIPSVLYIN